MIRDREVDRALREASAKFEQLFQRTQALEDLEPITKEGIECAVNTLTILNMFKLQEEDANSNTRLPPDLR